MVQQLTLLHITDLHVGDDALARLHAHLTTTGRSLDAILVTGDLLNVWHPLEGPGGKEYDAPATDAMREDWLRLLHGTVARTLAGSAVPVLWIPGNHDPIEAFDGKGNAWLPADRLAGNVFPVHAKWERLAPGLVVAGLGGSVPAYEPGAEEPIWPGCPYATDAAFGEELEKCVRPVVEYVHGEGEQVVLMTHSGPAECATTLIDADPSTDPDAFLREHPTIATGSPALAALLRSPPTPPTQGKTLIPLLVHGHTHWARGVQNVRGTHVVNPGSLKDGRAAVIHLARGEATDGGRVGQTGWTVKTVELLEF
ncbi:hypothetical protein H9P43_005527 [Blastocladiella emersonii ATCC 22665]|nr:hypothetical protein H9P43_005527 [Blastocladiella emersonii ATCC 22665]